MCVFASKLRSPLIDQAGELASYLERVHKSKDEPDILTEEKLVELLKKGEKEEIVKALTAESTVLSSINEKGTTVGQEINARFRAGIQSLD
jgi:hypothetical protein